MKLPFTWSWAVIRQDQGTLLTIPSNIWLVADVESERGLEGWWEIVEWITTKLSNTGQVPAERTAAHSALLCCGRRVRGRCGALQVQGLCVRLCETKNRWMSWTGVQPNSPKQSMSYLTAWKVKQEKSTQLRDFREHPEISRHSLRLVQSTIYSKPRQQWRETTRRTLLLLSSPKQSVEAPDTRVGSKWYCKTIVFYDVQYLYYKRGRYFTKKEIDHILPNLIYY